MTVVADVADRIVAHRHEAIELAAVIDLAGQPERGKSMMYSTMTTKRSAQLADAIRSARTREGVGQEGARQRQNRSRSRAARCRHGINHRVCRSATHEPRALGQVGANAAEQAFGVEKTAGSRPTSVRSSAMRRARTSCPLRAWIGARDLNLRAVMRTFETALGRRSAPAHAVHGLLGGGRRRLASVRQQALDQRE